MTLYGPHDVSPGQRYVNSNPYLERQLDRALKAMRVAHGEDVELELVGASVSEDAQGWAEARGLTWRDDPSAPGHAGYCYLLVKGQPWA